MCVKRRLFGDLAIREHRCYRDCTKCFKGHMTRKAAHRTKPSPLFLLASIRRSKPCPIRLESQSAWFRKASCLLQPEQQSVTPFTSCDTVPNQKVKTRVDRADAKAGRGSLAGLATGAAETAFSERVSDFLAILQFHFVSPPRRHRARHAKAFPVVQSDHHGAQADVHGELAAHQAPGRD